MVGIFFAKERGTESKAEKQGSLHGFGNDRMSHSERIQGYGQGLAEEIHFQRTLLQMLISALHLKNISFSGFLKIQQEAGEKSKAAARDALIRVTYLDLKYSRSFKVDSHSAIILGTWLSGKYGQ